MNRQWRDYGWQKLETCPICGCQDFAGPSIEPKGATSVRDRADGMAHVDYSKCRDCEGEFQNPMMRPEDMVFFYASGDYRYVVHGHREMTLNVLCSQHARGNAVAQWMRRFIPTIKYAIEIGSGGGAFLKAVQEAYGAEVAGVELDGNYRSHANIDGVPTVGTLEELPKRRADLVALIHTLEHLARPLAILKRIRADFLEPEGRLIVEVPWNSKGDVHPIAFQWRTLEVCLDRAGYRPIKETYFGIDQAEGKTNSVLRMVAEP